MPEQRVLLIAQCQSMSLLLNERLGDANPWALINFDEFTDSELPDIRKLMHELLYSPPPRR